MNWRLLMLALALALIAPGCSGTRVLSLMDEASLAEHQAQSDERVEQFADAELRYAESALLLEEALELAEERKQAVLVSYMTTKLSIVTAARARCLAPDQNPAGSWKAAYDLYAKSGDYAARVQLLKLKRNARRGQALCLLPSRNPEGDWLLAAELYAEAAALSKEVQDDESEGEDLRNQAICLLEGDMTVTEFSVPIRRMLVEARTLGDTVAADLLAQAKGRYCVACSHSMQPEVRFCSQCGQDQGALEP